MSEPTEDPPPTPPEEPDAADCCGEGCARCVFDVYEEALARYDAAMAAWRLRHPSGHDGSTTARQE